MMQRLIVLMAVFSKCLQQNQISSVFVALSWSLLDEHQLTTSDIQSWSTHLAYSGATKPHEQVCADENIAESELHRESKKGAMAITLSILDRFAKFFHCCKEQ